MAAYGKEYDASGTRPTYRDEVKLIARDAIEERERLARAWKLLEDALIEARLQRDEALEVLRELRAAATDAYMSDLVSPSPFIRAGNLLAKAERWV